MALRAADLRLLNLLPVSGQPKVRAGPPARVAVAVHEAAPEQIHQPGVQRLDPQRILRRANRIAGAAT